MTDRLQGEVLGVRAWTLLGGYGLRALVANYVWHPGVNEARCQATHVAVWGGGAFVVLEEGFCEPAHSAPASGCSCGLYALHPDLEWFSLADQANPLDSRTVFGAVKAWGRIEVHGEGFRAEYAEPVAFAYADGHQTTEHVSRIHTIGAELEVPVVEIRDLSEFATRFAAPVPSELRPPTAARVLDPWISPPPPPPPGPPRPPQIAPRTPYQRLRRRDRRLRWFALGALAANAWFGLHGSRHNLIAAVALAAALGWTAWRQSR